MPSAWWNCGDKDLYMNINQYLANGNKEYWYKGFDKSTIEEVVVIDGVFMAARKDNSISFNTKLTGFHNYDLNLSFEYLKKGYIVVVTNNILLDHFSIGELPNTMVFLSFSEIIFKTELSNPIPAVR